MEHWMNEVKKKISELESSGEPPHPKGLPAGKSVC